MHKIIDKITRRTTRSVRSLRKVLFQTMRYMRGSREMVIIGSAHKVGSTWLYNLVMDLYDFNAYNLPRDVIERHPDELPVDIDLQSILEMSKIPAGGYIYKTHSFPPDSIAAELPAWMKFITILRDPRDVIISSCFYLALIPEEKGGWGEDFRNLDIQNRIIRVIENGAFLRQRLHRWNQSPYVHKVRYEALLSKPVDELHRLSLFLGAPRDKDRIRKIYNKHSFKKRTGRNPGDEDVKSPVRKGIAGDWKNYFDEEVKKAFKYSCDGHWNELLLELGYEENREW